MVIYGTALLAVCYLAGMAAGEGIARIIGVKANVGGVGLAMLLLVLCLHGLRTHNRYPEETERGVTFWAAMYIPVVVAMAATQNVAAAVTSGPIAALAAVASVASCFFLVGVINRRAERGRAAETDEPVSLTKA